MRNLNYLILYLRVQRYENFLTCTTVIARNFIVVLVNEKKNGYSFCVSSILPYLCIRIIAMMMTTTLYLVRHGETVDNARSVMQGQTQGELNGTGIEQARDVACKMAHEPIDAFVSSDLRRSLHTAQIIAAPHGMTVTTTPLLRERDWGDFTGRYIPDLKGLPFPENVESMEQLLERASRFLDFIRSNYAGKKVLAVGHGIINKAIQAVYYKKSTREIERMMNAEVRVLEL